MDEQPMPQSHRDAPILTWKPGNEVDRALGAEVVRRLRSGSDAVGSGMPGLDEYDCREILIHLSKSLGDVVPQFCYERFLHVFRLLFALRETPEPAHVERSLTALADAVEVGLREPRTARRNLAS